MESTKEKIKLFFWIAIVFPISMVIIILSFIYIMPIIINLALSTPPFIAVAILIIIWFAFCYINIFQNK
jgi:hypothetical protein